ncbi:MAG: helix-turn-helix domain-containing protein [Ignavibacteriae bacterium]|nr:helix-turn-helix domain-containing protein [Flavobacteriaceae bacterium]MCB0703463.1 helix-turn-helix domain-containing protein [Ignavibacteriota bacterium]
MEGLIITSITADSLKEVITAVVEDCVTKALSESRGAAIQSDLITRREAAELLGISLPTLGKWTKEGLVPAHRISSRVRYKRSEVIESLKAIKTSKNS